MVHGRRQPDIAPGEHGTGLQQDVALLEIEARRAHEAAHGGCFLHGDGVAVDVGVFLDDDGVGAVRQRRAGKDTHCLAGTDGAVKAAARRRLTDTGQGCRGAGDISGAHGVTVHGGNIGRRQGQVGLQVFGQDPAEGVGEIDFLGIGQPHPGGYLF